MSPDEEKNKLKKRVDKLNKISNACMLGGLLMTIGIFIMPLGIILWIIGISKIVKAFKKED